MAQGWYFCQEEFKQYKTKIITWNSAAKHTFFFLLPQILVISRRQVTDISIQESFRKISSLIKKKQHQVCVALDLITQKGQVIKKICTFKGLEGTAGVVYHCNTDQISMDLFSFPSWHQCPVWCSWGLHKQNKQNSDILLWKETH